MGLRDELRDIAYQLRVSDAAVVRKAETRLDRIEKHLIKFHYEFCIGEGVEDADANELRGWCETAFVILRGES